MKTEFKLEKAGGLKIRDAVASFITIVGKSPKHSPYVTISTEENKLYFIKDKDLERFATNILKALHPKPSRKKPTINGRPVKLKK